MAEQRGSAVVTIARRLGGRPVRRWLRPAAAFCSGTVWLRPNRHRNRAGPPQSPRPDP